jgi:dihydrofolate reductase
VALSIVVAMDRRRCIGRDGRLPWRLPADLRRFREITLGKPVVMGRGTHESIGRPLPGRINIVISRDPAYGSPGCTVVGSLEAALAAAPDRDIMVIGGASIYAEALPLARRIYLTEVHGEFECDVQFPAFDRRAWVEAERTDHQADAANAHPYSFVVLERANQA